MKLNELSAVLINHANANFAPATIPGFKTVLKGFLSTAEKLGINEPCQDLYDAFRKEFSSSRSKKNLAVCFCRLADLKSDTHALYDEETFFNDLPLPAEEDVRSIFDNTPIPITNIELPVLCVKSSMVLKGHMLSKSTIGQYWKVWKAIICRSFQSGSTIFKKDFLESFIEIKEAAYESGQIKYWQFKIARKATYVLMHVAETGGYSWCYDYEKPKLNVTAVNPIFSEYIDFLAEKGYEKNTVKAHSHVFRRIFNNSDISDIDSLKDFDSETVKGMVGYYSERYSRRSMRAVEPVIREILDFLYDNHYTNRRLSGIVPKTCSVKDDVAAYISDEDCIRIVNSLDNYTKRDKAIILIAYCLGLRGSDICNLKFDNIDWNAEKIHLVQVKTGRPMTLPLVAAVGNALYDYMTGERPEEAKDIPYIFVSGRAPYGQLHRIYGICRKILKDLGIKTTNAEAYGPHVFRYTLVHRLLVQSVPHEVITDSLGHGNKDADKYYISMEEDMLRKCGLDIPEESAVWGEDNEDTGQTI